MSSELSERTHLKSYSSCAESVGSWGNPFLAVSNPASSSVQHINDVCSLQTVAMTPRLLWSSKVASRHRVIDHSDLESQQPQSRNSAACLSEDVCMQILKVFGYMILVCLGLAVGVVAIGIVGIILFYLFMFRVVIILVVILCACMCRWTGTPSDCHCLNLYFDIVRTLYWDWHMW